MAQDHWLHGFNYNVEEWFEGDHYETLAICRHLAIARAAFKEAVAEKPTGRFMISSRAPTALAMSAMPRIAARQRTSSEVRDAPKAAPAPLPKKHQAEVGC
jgi:hypothetical protein